MPEWHCSCACPECAYVELDAATTYDDWGDVLEEEVCLGELWADFDDLPDNLADRLRVECAELLQDHIAAEAENEWERLRDDAL
jgi:hypothetical protein